MSVLDSRETILSEASRLFASKGYSSVSMRHVAEHVGMTPANLYYHFKNKEDLIRESLAFVLTGKTQPLEDIIRDQTDPERRFTLFASWFSRLLFEDDIFAKLVCRELLDGDERRMEFLAKNVLQRPFSILVNIIEDFLETKDSALSAASVVGMILGHYQLAKVLQHLYGNHPEYGHPDWITAHVLDEFRSRAATRSDRSDVHG